MERKFHELIADPYERDSTEYFGRRSIKGSVGCLVLGGLGLACAAGFSAVFSVYHFDFAVLLVAIGTIALLVAAVLFSLYPFVYLIRIFRYARYQRELNDLPIGRRAKRFAVMTLLVDLGLLAATAVVVILPLLPLFTS